LTEAVVDLAAKTLTVVFDEGAVTLADIEEAVEDQGFDVVR
jgi:copper chaperone CopZ